MNSVKSDHSILNLQINSILMFSTGFYVLTSCNNVTNNVSSNTMCLLWVYFSLLLDLICHVTLLFYYCAVAILEIDVKEMQMHIGCWFFLNKSHMWILK